MRNSTINKLYKKIKKLSILITLLFLVLGTSVPNLVHATETTSGIQMSFDGENTTYQSTNLGLQILINSNQQINSTSVTAKLDGQLLISNFEYEGNMVYDEQADNETYVINYLAGSLTVNPQNLRDGLHTLSVTAADASGIPVTKQWNFNVSVKPVFSNPNPANCQVTNNKSGFSVKVTDNDGIKESSISLLLDNTLVPTTFNATTGQISFNSANGLSDGVHTIKVTLQDIAGNSSTFNSSFTVCTKGPTLTFDQSGKTLKSNEDLNVTIKSAVSLSTATVKLNGQPIQTELVFPGDWVLDWDSYEWYWVVTDYTTASIKIAQPNLKDGSQTLEVTAKDYLNNTTTQSWNFNVSISPVFGTPTPANGSVVSDNTGFSLSVTDNTTVNPDSIVATLDGVAIQTAFNNSTGIISYKVDPNCDCQCSGCNFTPLSDGKHTVNIIAEDMAGNKSNYSWSFTVVTKGPNLDFQYKDQKLTSIPELSVQLSSLADLNLSNFTFKLDGNLVNPEHNYKGHWVTSNDEEMPDQWVVDSLKEGTLSFNPGNLSDGLHTLEVTAKDVLGNTSSQKWNFTIDMKPEFTNATPATGSSTFQSPGFSVNVVDYNDGLQGISSFIVKLNGETVDAQYDQTTKLLSYYPQNGLPNGDYTVNIEATDKAGTKTEYTWSFKVNSVSPSIVFLEDRSSMTATYTPVPTLTFKVKANSNTTLSSNKSDMPLKIDGVLISPSLYSVVFPGHWESDYNAEEDYYYNERYIVDNTKEATVTFKAPIMTGNHTVSFSAKDILGNTTTIEGTFATNYTYNLSITSPSNNAIVKSIIPIQTYSNLHKINISIKNNSTNTIQNLGDATVSPGLFHTQYRWDTTTTSNGQYTIILTGYDAVGKSMKTESVVTVAN